MRRAEQIQITAMILGFVMAVCGIAPVVVAMVDPTFFSLGAWTGGLAVFLYGAFLLLVAGIEAEAI